MTKRPMSIDAWNELHPPGTQVTYEPVVGSNAVPSIQTRTRSRAWVLADGTWVVSIVGHAGGVAVDHIEVVPPTPSDAAEIARARRIEDELRLAMDVSDTFLRFRARSVFLAILEAVEDFDAVEKGLHPAEIVRKHLQRGNLRTRPERAPYLRDDGMLSRTILYMSQLRTLSCDGRCEKAWGLNGRARLQLSEDDPDDFVWLADPELGLAPADPGTYEGSDGKPDEYEKLESKWCARECERSALSSVGVRVRLRDLSRRRYNRAPHVRDDAETDHGDR